MTNLPFAASERDRCATGEGNNTDVTAFGISQASAVGRDGTDGIAVADDAELMRGRDVIESRWLGRRRWRRRPSPDQADQRRDKNQQHQRSHPNILLRYCVFLGSTSRLRVPI